MISPNKVFRGGSDARIKTDTRDATAIAWMLRREEGESIAIPTKEDESTRDLVRCREDLQGDLKRAKQRLLKYLLRHGVEYENTRYWTGKHYRWLKGVKFEAAGDQGVFDEYLSVIRGLEDRITRMDARIKEAAESEPYAERVKMLRAFRGIDNLTALTLICEIGDFRRFPTAEAFMAYLGLVPSEHSSGKKRQQGGITKAGNGHIRKLLVESSWQYPRPEQVSKRLAERRVGTDERTIAPADKAIHRLHQKYVRLLFGGKSKQAAITAVARELSGFIWAVMNRAV